MIILDYRSKVKEHMVMPAQDVLKILRTGVMRVKGYVSQVKKNMMVGPSS